MVAVVPRPPQRRHWDKLRDFRVSKPKHPIVELEQFLSFWEVSNAELAEICECSLSTVERWFFLPDNPNLRNPTEKHKQLLAEAHYLWWLESNRSRAELLKQMYKEKKRDK
jgi:hypothetical protein